MTSQGYNQQNPVHGSYKMTWYLQQIYCTGDKSGMGRKPIDLET